MDSNSGLPAAFSFRLEDHPLARPFDVHELVGSDDDFFDTDEDEDEGTPPTATLPEPTLEAVAQFILANLGGPTRPPLRIVVLTGAGISTSAGIPDFRSPNTGLYATLERSGLERPEDVFDLEIFRYTPEPFYAIAHEIYPGRFHPTISHVFISLLAKKNLLAMLFTQNIDCLERAAGIPEGLIVEAHGSFATQSCIECRAPYPDDLMREHIQRGEVARCLQPECDGHAKPDIVFFGEKLHDRFFEEMDRILPGEEMLVEGEERVELMFIMGTSLPVPPFANLPELCPGAAPRVLFNRERVGDLGYGLDDVVVLGDCDSSVRRLVDLLGWREELEAEWRRIVGDEEAEKQLARAEASAAAAAAAAAAPSAVVETAIVVGGTVSADEIPDSESDDDLDEDEDTPLSDSENRAPLQVDGQVNNPQAAEQLPQTNGVSSPPPPPLRTRPDPAGTGLTNGNIDRRRSWSPGRGEGARNVRMR